ncbi:MAG TPA: exonuclease SbcCD subunit D [Dehalococcoidales bacterium]|nr:exonuclease SbcCD subunit D [Dehalococcoidales bacterium]
MLVWKLMKIVHFADLHLGVENYGHINPVNGLSSRLEDFLSALDEMVDYAIHEKVDMVLFCGDAYKTREPSQTQQREFAKRIRRLSQSGIPLFLLIGNHDLPNAVGRATALEIFETLSIANVYVASKPGLFRVPTASGIIQVAALPWVRRSALLSREDTQGLDFNQINERLQQILTDVIASHASQINPAVPSILAAHVWVMNARLGTEKGMSIGQEHMLLPGNVANPAFDYVALGHIHKAQVLNEYPPVVYSGSLERVDFGDENDEKGFYVVEINQSGPDAGKTTAYAFHPVNARRFFTLKIEVSPDDLDPTASILRTIEPNLARIEDAVVRIEISLPEALSNRLRDVEIYRLAEGAYHLTISRNIQREVRLRLGRGSLEGISPRDALQAFLESKYSPERARILLAEGEKLIQTYNQKL